MAVVTIEVAPEGMYWVVQQPELDQPAKFLGRPAAIKYARRIAQERAPSILVIRDASGNVESREANGAKPHPKAAAP